MTELLLTPNSPPNRFRKMKARNKNVAAQISKKHKPGETAMKRVWKTMLQTSKTHSAPLFASALFAVAAAVTPTTVCAQAGHAANHQASTSAAATAIPQSSQNELAKLDALPPAGRSYISATLGGDMPGYHVEARGAGFHAAARGLDSDFTAQGVEISADSAHIRLALVAYGHGDGLNQAGSASANRVSPNRVE
jgi:hypothetical protein